MGIKRMHKQKELNISQRIGTFMMMLPIGIQVILLSFHSFK
jgi:hypothetical protein